MKRVVIAILMLSTASLFAGSPANRQTQGDGNRVLNDGTSMEAADFGSQPAYAQSSSTSIKLSGGQIIGFGTALVAAAIGTGIGISNQNDASRGDGHLTHASKRTQ